MNMPVPFVGREEELTTLGEGLRDHRSVVVRGPQGMGKTRLAEHFMAVGSHAVTSNAACIQCFPGDGADSLLARGERALGLLPGTLSGTHSADQQSASWLLIVDDMHHLSPTAARAFAAHVALDTTRAGAQGHPHSEPASAGGRWLLIARETLPACARGGWLTLDLGGLAESAARDLWHRLEDSYGPTKQGACDRALVRTSGAPLALCQEYACAAAGRESWLPADLSPGAHNALAALATCRVPLTAAGIADLWSRVTHKIDGVGGYTADTDNALAGLVARQLIEPLTDGAYRIHDQVRALMATKISTDERISLMTAAVDLLLGESGSDERVALVTDPGVAAPSLSHPVARVREAAHHALDCGDPQRAYQIVCNTLSSGAGQGAEAELAGILYQLEASADPARARAISTIRARVAARHGRVAEALELCQGSDGTFDAVEAALLCYRSGDVAAARRQLQALVADDAPAVSCRAAAALAEIELPCGGLTRAQSLVADAFERHRARVDNSARARLHLALAAIEEHAGRIASARASLSRAAGSGILEPGLAALIEARRSVCLLQEGRSNEAENAIAEAERWALTVDATAVADEIRRVRGLLALYRGEVLKSTGILRELVGRLRQRGDEMGALRAEVDLSRAHVLRGSLVQAAELVSACNASAARRKLRALEAEIQLVGAMIDLIEHRSSSARIELERVLDNDQARADVRLGALAHRAILRARTEPLTGSDAPTGQQAHADEHADQLAHLATSEVRTPLDRAWMEALLSHARGDIADALLRARRVAVHAERAGHRLDMAEALSLCARLSFARGERQSATAEAMCVVRESSRYGLVRPHADGLLVLAALARDDGDVEAAVRHAREAGALATEAGLPVARLVAAEAIESIVSASDSDDASTGRHAARATMSAAALEVSSQILADLGLTAVRPFRVVSAGGSQNFVADADPERLGLYNRTLVIDGVREQIIRDGETIADLRRRSLLKRLFFLFAAAPGQIYTKEEIVETVWRVDYHPLRHDAALFTNIMRIRRLLGKDGSDLVRVCEDGYRFLPPKDYLYVEAANSGDTSEKSKRR